MKSENKCKRTQQDIRIIAEPSTLTWLGDLFGCNKNQAADIVAAIVMQKQKGEDDSCN